MVRHVFGDTRRDLSTVGWWSRGDTGAGRENRNTIRELRGNVHGNDFVPIFRVSSCGYNNNNNIILLFRGNNIISIYDSRCAHRYAYIRRYNCGVRSCVCVKIRRGACALLGVCTRAQKDRSIGMCARARVCVCVSARGRGCRPPGLLPPPQLHHRSNVTADRREGERRTSARARRMARR